jgi:hypothetical protein
MYKNITLYEWQNMYKPLNDIIVQASITDGTSRNESFKFPIGMHHSYISLTTHNQKTIQIGLHNNLVLCAMKLSTDSQRRGNTNINRKIIIQNLHNNDIHNIMTNSYNYYNKLSDYKFVISPEGNGIDCHRHYEALLSGCIPIIEHNDNMKRKYTNLPILYTTNYSEINQEYLIHKYNELINNNIKYDFSKLFLSNYNKKNKSTIKLFSNFWCIKRHNQTYY